MNAETFFHAPHDGNLWSSDFNNETGGGLLADVFRDLSDIGVANMFMLPTRYSLTFTLPLNPINLVFRARVLAFTQPHYIAHLCFLIKSPSEIPRFMAIVMPFSLLTWISIGLMVVG